MDDLRQRFASLDRVPAPDLWNEAVRRAATQDPASTVLEPVRPRGHVDRAARGAGPAAGRAVRWQTSPTLRALMALVVIATLLVGVLAAGWIRLQNPVVVAPSGSALTSSAPTESPMDPVPTVSPGPTPRVATPACSSATVVDDIRDTWRPRNTEASWVSGPLPLDGNVAGDITAIARGLPEIDLAETPHAVVLVRPNTGRMCRLAALPPAFWVYGLHWSASGDALAIVLHPGDPGPAGVLVWSRLGITQPWVGEGHKGVGVAWSPDGSTLAILTEDKAELVFADGSPTAEIDCPDCDDRPDLGGPYYLGRPAWSPDGSKISMEMQGMQGSRVVVADVARRRGIVLEVGVNGIEPVAWRDDDNLMVLDSNQVLIVPIAAPREYTVQVQLPGGEFDHILAPDLNHAAYLTPSGERAVDLVVVDLRDGSIVLRVQPTSGETSGIDAFAWAPDSRQLVYTRWGSRIHDMWVVVIDPREEHHITRGDVHLSDMSLLRSGLDGGSWRENTPGQP